MTKLEFISFSHINQQEWTNFHKSCSDPVLFYQFPFLRAYQETTGEGIDVLVYKENERNLIMLPGIYDKKRKMFTNLTFHGWDNLNFLMVSWIREDTIKVFFAELFKIAPIVIYNNISQSCHETIMKFNMNSVAFKKFRCPFVLLPSSYHDYLETLSVSFKRMLKNRTNFCEKHGVKFRFLTNHDKELFEDAFMELNRLHEIRMDEIDTKSKFLRSDSQRFHHMLRRYPTNDKLLILQARKDEKVIGTLYGFLSVECYVYFSAGIDPHYSKYSLGVVMIGRMMDHLIENYYKFFDFLRGTEAYKFKWTKKTNQNYTIYTYRSVIGKSKAMKYYWQENKKRLGKKKTLFNLKSFL